MFRVRKHIYVTRIPGLTFSGIGILKTTLDNKISAPHTNSLKGLKCAVICKTWASIHELENSEIMSEYICTTKNTKPNISGSNIFCLLKHTFPRLLQLQIETFFFLIPHTYTILLTFYLKYLSESK